MASSTKCSYYKCGNYDSPEMKMKKCSGCLCVAYCSIECQSLDWPTHKKFCCEIGKDKQISKFKKSLNKKVVFNGKETTIRNLCYFFASVHRQQKSAILFNKEKKSIMITNYKKAIKKLHIVESQIFDSHENSILILIYDGTKIFELAKLNKKNPVDDDDDEYEEFPTEINYE
jgi:hypothetical protein